MTQHVAVALAAAPLLLTQTTVPLTLSVTKKVSASTTHNTKLFLKCSGIFGSTLCPNFDVLWQLPGSNGQSEYIGTLSFYGNHPKGDINPDGLSQHITIPESLMPQLLRVITTQPQLNFMLKAQDDIHPENTATIERIELIMGIIEREGLAIH